MNIKNGILNVPKHGNKHDLIHFVTTVKIQFVLWVAMETVIFYIS